MSISAPRGTRVAAASRLALVLATVLGVLFVAPSAARASVQAAVSLGAAGPFAVLGDDVPNIGLTTINGDLGVPLGGAVTGFPPGVVNGATHVGGTAITAARTDLTTAYDDARLRTADTTLTGQDLAGLTLTPGVYKYGVTAQLTGTVTLDGQNNPDAVFIIQVGTTLDSAAASAVNLINGAQACNTFWQVGSAVTLEAATVFRGTIMASTAMTIGAGSTVDGRLLTRAGPVTIDSVTVTPASCGTLGVTSPLAADFAGRGITGAAQTTVAALDAFSVSDARNSGAGWRVSAQATTFTGTSRTLAPGSLSMSPPLVTPDGTSSPAPTVTPGPSIIDSGHVTIATAATGHGMGTYSFSATTLTLALPPDVYADVYASTVTISVVNAP